MTSGEGGAREGVLSRHPVDRLIRELIQSGREATLEEVEQILARLATAPFNPRDRWVSTKERGTRYRGQVLGARAASLTYHLTKRVVLEEQRADSTTADQYLADLRRAVRDPAGRLAIYERRGGHVAATIAPTERVVPPARQGRRPQPWLLVIYLVDQGIILTAYQFSTLEQTGIPKEARWLK